MQELNHKIKVRKRETIRISERKWSGEPILITRVQTMPSGIQLIHSITESRYITLFLEETFISQSDVEFLNKKPNTYFIFKSGEEVVIDKIENLEHKQNNEQENDEPPF